MAKLNAIHIELLRYLKEDRGFTEEANILEEAFEVLPDDDLKNTWDLYQMFWWDHEDLVKAPEVYGKTDDFFTEMGVYRYVSDFMYNLDEVVTIDMELTRI